MAQDRIEEIAALLVQAGHAHETYEKNDLHGVYDQAWARWYASYTVEEGISALLGHAVTVEQLTAFFSDSYARFQQAHAGEAWADFTAREMQAILQGQP